MLPRPSMSMNAHPKAVAAHPASVTFSHPTTARQRPSITRKAMPTIIRRAIGAVTLSMVGGRGPFAADVCRASQTAVARSSRAN